MSNSLREQLMKSGLASEEDAKRAESGKRRKGPKKKKSQRQAHKSEAATHAELFDRAKRERDRDLNRQREAERERVAAEKAARKMVIDAQIAHGQNKDTDVAFNFTHGNRIKRLYVTPEQQARLARGELAIARTRGRFWLIPAEIAAKVESIAPFLIAFQVTDSGSDDPAYEQHPIPDDLMW